MPASTWFMICGLTASTSTSGAEGGAAEIALSFKSAAISGEGCGSATASELGWMPAASQPRNNAPPMRPAPAKKIECASPLMPPSPIPHFKPAGATRRHVPKGYVAVRGHCSPDCAGAAITGAPACASLLNPATVSRLM